MLGKALSGDDKMEQIGRFSDEIIYTLTGSAVWRFHVSEALLGDLEASLRF